MTDLEAIKRQHEKQRQDIIDNYEVLVADLKETIKVLKAEILKLDPDFAKKVQEGVK